MNGRIEGEWARTQPSRITRDHGSKLRITGSKAGDSQPDSDAMTIAVSDCDESRARASALLNKMYAWRGYGSSHAIPAGSNCTTFVATAATAMIGTLTLRVDSPDGLSADQTFADVIQTFRDAPGASICELTKFAFDTSSPARPRLAALFHTVLIYGSVHHDCTDLFIEVNPRHRGFYEAMLGFRPVAEARTNAAVGAPSHLLWLNVDEIRRNITLHRGAVSERTRSLYPHFLSQEEEHCVVNALRERRLPLARTIGHFEAVTPASRVHAHRSEAHA